MAKKGKRPLVAMVCQDCKKNGKITRNYVTNRSVVNTKDKLELKKFCKVCRATTVHKETKLPSSKKQ